MTNKEGKEALTPEQWWDSQKVMTFEDFKSFVESYALLKGSGGDRKT
jgi:hypothetical protein